MVKKLFKLVSGFSITVLGFIIAPVTFAQSAIENGLQNSGVRNLFPNSPLSVSGSQTLTGPNGLIFNLISMLLGVAGAVAIVFIIIGGFWYITSAGNEEQAEKGKNTLLNAIIGIVVIVLSYVIISVVSSFVANGV